MNVCRIFYGVVIIAAIFNEFLLAANPNPNTQVKSPQVKAPTLDEVINLPVLQYQSKEEFKTLLGTVYDTVQPYYEKLMSYVSSFLTGFWFKFLILLTILSLFWKLVGRTIYHWICWIICRLLRCGSDTYRYHSSDYYGDF